MNQQREIKFRVWDDESMIYPDDDMGIDHYLLDLKGNIYFYQSCDDGTFDSDFTKKNGCGCNTQA